MTPKISVIAPTRGRRDLLNRMLRSLTQTADDMASVEVVLRVDYDDPDTIEYLLFEGAALVIVGPRRQGYATLAGLINEAARLSHGDVVLVVNDDAEFLTHGWDTKLLARAAAFPDGMFDLGIETANADNFIFPCVSRALINALGCVFDERLVYTDIWLRDALMPFDRAVRVPEVTIRHHWAGLTPDQQKALILVQQSTYPALYAQCVDEARAKIQPCIVPVGAPVVEVRR